MKWGMGVDIEQAAGVAGIDELECPAVRSSAAVTAAEREERWKAKKRFRAARRAHKRKNGHNIVSTALVVCLLIAGVKWWDGGSRGTRYAPMENGGYAEFDFLGYRRLETTTIVHDFDFQGRQLEEEVRLRKLLSLAWASLSGLLVSPSSLTSHTYIYTHTHTHTLNLSTSQEIVCAADTNKTKKQLDCEANAHCISPEYNFVDEPFTETEVRNGGLMFHFLIMMWMFAGLAIVCDDYFEASLEAICER